MSKYAARIGDLGSGHDDCPPTDIITGSSRFTIRGIPVARVTDKLRSHGCRVHNTHPRSIAKGSSRIYIEGLAMARISDPIDCGGKIIEGADRVTDPS